MNNIRKNFISISIVILKNVVYNKIRQHAVLIPPPLTSMLRRGGWRGGLVSGLGLGWG